jgi:hypothetical protein
MKNLLIQNCKVIRDIILIKEAVNSLKLKLNHITYNDDNTCTACIEQSTPELLMKLNNILDFDILE